MVWSRVVKFGRCKRPLGCAFCCSCENLLKFGLGISLWKTRPYVKNTVQRHVRTWAIQRNSPIISPSPSLMLLSYSVPLLGSGVSTWISPGPTMNTGVESRGRVSSELHALTLLTNTGWKDAQREPHKGTRTWSRWWIKVVLSHHMLQKAEPVESLSNPFLLGEGGRAPECAFRQKLCVSCMH